MDWNENLETGVKLIDDQHKSIIDKMNRIFLAGQQGQAKGEIIPTLTFLKNYVIEHFNDEEKLQIESKYPMFQQHKLSHIKFISDVDKLLSEFQNEGITLNIIMKTNQTISDLFVNHISSEDKQFAAFYREKYYD